MNEEIQVNQEEIRPCEGCGGMTKKNAIHAECWECKGDGYIEDSDWLGQWGYKKCYNCMGKGEIILHLFYCSDECYAYSTPED